MAETVNSRGPVALITGITGQDGSYLAELLLEKDIRSMASYVGTRFRTFLT